MRRTICRCDRCQQEGEDVVLYEVQVCVARYKFPGAQLVKHAEWCKDCLVQLGIWNPDALQQKRGVEQEEDSTLEDLVRAIVREEVEEAVGEAVEERLA